MIMLRDILVHVEGTGDGSVVDFAVKLALKNNARLTGISLRPPTQNLYELGGVAAAPAFDEVALAAKAKQIFEDATQGTNIETEWRELSGPAIRDLELHARFADLTILSRGDRNSWFEGIANQFVLKSGQPAIFVPQAWSADIVANRALVAWNSTRESKRALDDAMPLLETADLVEVVTVIENDVHDNAAEAGLDIIGHLGTHGIKAALTYSELCDDAGRSLLDHATDHDCDLLVMGFYGHSPLSELVFGGASRTVLYEMTIPVLMAH
jgi:nucleotide-binding universal stress UspA family protein